MTLKGCGTTLLGLLFMAIGIGVTVAAAVSHPIPMIVLFGGFAMTVLGALLVNPTATSAGIKQLVVIVGPFVPGGRRFTDPPANPPTPPKGPGE